MNVQSFPRPPLLEKISRHVQIKFGGDLIVDTKEAYWALETHHPPSTCVVIPFYARDLTDVDAKTWRFTKHTMCRPSPSESR